MSAETIEWLNENSLIGNTDKRGNAWHYREGSDNHFAGPVPVERVLSLLDIPLAESTLTSTVITEDGVQSWPIEGRKGIVRLDTGKTFGIFGEGYPIHGYTEWLHDNLEEITGAGLDIGSAILLKEGALAAVQAELDETRTAAEGVQHRPWITAATSCDGSLATTYLLGTQLWVCDNTLSLALAETSALKVKIRHSRNSAARVGSVKYELGLAVEQIGDAFDAEIKKLTSEFVSDETWNAFVKAYSNVATAKPGRSKTMADTKVGILNKLWKSDARVAPWKNSAYGVVAAVNTAVHHEFTIKGMERAERNFLRTVTDEWADVDGGALKLLASVR
jgi:phage/plasmid-like protein (TIGR03299 family)